MVSLVDIGSLKEEVEIRGQKIEVKGLPAKFIVDLLASSNELRMLMAERALTGDLAMTLVADLPNMAAECIAAATNKAGDAETIAFILRELNPQEWVDLLEPIIRLTFPRGARSFVEGLVQAARRNGLGVPGWDQAMKSPEPSPSASSTGIPQTPPGDTRPGSSPGGANSSSVKATETA